MPGLFFARCPCFGGVVSHLHIILLEFFGLDFNEFVLLIVSEVIDFESMPEARSSIAA